jgi:hypothetical protein
LPHQDNIGLIPGPNERANDYMNKLIRVHGIEIAVYLKRFDRIHQQKEAVSQI